MITLAINVVGRERRALLLQDVTTEFDWEAAAEAAYLRIHRDIDVEWKLELNEKIKDAEQYDISWNQTQDAVDLIALLTYDRDYLHALTSDEKDFVSLLVLITGISMKEIQRFNRRRPTAEEIAADLARPPIKVFAPSDIAWKKKESKRLRARTKKGERRQKRKLEPILQVPRLY
jgi:hypothetical protein